MKVIPISAELSKSELKYRPIHQEFQNRNWYIKVLSASFASEIDFYKTLVISCNFVTSEMYSETGAVVSFRQPLQVFLLKLSATNGQNTSRFNDDIWFKVNSSAFELKFFISDINNTDIKNALKVFLVFAIRQQ